MASHLSNQPVLKPLPSSGEEFVSEYESFHGLQKNSEGPPRALLLHFMLSSASIQRHTDFAMILMLGSSGVGKSSTINHMFDSHTNDSTPVAMTSGVKSATKKTSEYIISFDEPLYEVCNLEMHVIDTPGFNDTSGANQDACNLFSIKEFFNTHPKLPESKIYPNLVFLVVNATDTRLGERDSNLSKTLRGVKMLDLVDTNCPNLVVILTFCCSIGYTNTEKWKKKMQEKIAIVGKIVFEALGIVPPVVLIENDPDDDHELKKDGDFTVLPDGEKQPKNLYKACVDVLMKGGNGVKDKFGHMVLNAAFNQKKQDEPTSGHTFDAKDSKIEKLSQEELELVNTFSKPAEVEPLTSQAMQYVTENNIEESQQNSILKLVETMNRLGLSDEAKLKSATISEINCSHDDDITGLGLQMLREKFELKNSSNTSFNPAAFIGQGYNVIQDKSVSAQVLKFPLVNDERFGFNIPNCAHIVKVNQTRESQLNFQSNEKYIESRLQNLGLNVDLASSILKMAPQFGMNYCRKNGKSATGSTTAKKSLQEVRIAKINIENFESHGIAYTDDFLSAVEDLPTRNTKKENQEQFNLFFNRFGQFLVTSAFVGGAVEIETYDSSLEFESENEDSVCGSVEANLPAAVGAKIGGKDKSSRKQVNNKVLNIGRTDWEGGCSDLHTDGTLKSEEKFLMWKKSIANNPVVLKDQLHLEPISTLVGKIDKKKGKVCYQALQNLFQNKPLVPVCNHHDQAALEAQEKMKKDQQNEANTREGSTVKPDIDGWWQTFTGHFGAIVAGVTTVAAAVAVAAAILARVLK